MQSNFEYIRNNKYIDHRVIMGNLMSLFKQKDFNEPDIINWCQEVETRDIGDVDNMVKFVQVPLKVDNFVSADLPCNIYRILDVFNANETPIPFTTSQNGSKLIFRKELNLTGVYINYVGMPVSEDGTPLIVRGHENACLYKCITNAFMEDFALGKISQGAYALWEQKATGYILEASSNRRHYTREDWNNLNIIQGNLIPKIGGLSLYHLMYK